jgi:hypothetical protein
VSGYDATSFGERFLQDADEATRHQAWERVTAQSAAAFMTPTGVAGWQGIDSTYLVCAQDRSTPVELQRLHAARATRSVELPTGHHRSSPVPTWSSIRSRHCRTEREHDKHVSTTRRGT